MSDKSLMALPEHIDELFMEMDSRIVIALQDSDEGYSALMRERDSMTHSFPKIHAPAKTAGEALRFSRRLCQYNATRRRHYVCCSVNE